MAPIIHIKKTRSTNTYLKDILLVKKPEEETIVYADYQSEGRGQRGNSWESEAGRNLLFSTILYPTHIKASEQFIISQIISLAIKDFLSKRIDDVTIKWPNDIYWKNKKLGGILIENALKNDTIEQSVIGVGLNVNQLDFKSNAPNPVSLRHIFKGQEQDRSAILQMIAYYMHLYYKDSKNGLNDEIAERYKQSLFRNEGYHLYYDSSGYFSARLCDVEPSGILVLETKEGIVKRFSFKEVTYMLE